MKRTLVACLALVFLFTMVACQPAASNTPSPAPATQTIKIGNAVALTGGNATWGISENNALKMEIEKINAAGGVLGQKLELVAYDTKADQAEAVNVTKRLIGDKVVAIIGPGQSGVAIAMGSVTEPAGIPFIATSASNPKVTINPQTNAVLKTAFRTCFIDPFQGKVAAQFALKELGAKTAAILFDVGSDYSQGLKQYFTEAFEKAGGKIVAAEAFRSEELDYRAILGKIKTTNPDVLFIPTMQKEAGLAMKQARDLGMTAKFLGGDGWASKELIELGGPATEGAFYVNIASVEDPTIKTWVDEYKGKFNAMPVMPNPVMAVDGLRAVVHAIKQANSTEPAKIIEQLEKIKELPVLSGKLTIEASSHNPLNKPAVIETVKNGQFVFHKSYTTVD
ncbi:MAG: ABC transporter substrate-binding protein [Bacillota bacterium]